MAIQKWNHASGTGSLNYFYFLNLVRLNFFLTTFTCIGTILSTHVFVLTLIRFLSLFGILKSYNLFLSRLPIVIQYILSELRGLNVAISHHDCNK